MSRSRDEQPASAAPTPNRAPGEGRYPPEARVVGLRLEKGREKAVLDNGHPWLFSGAVASVEGPRDAPLARVRAADGRDLGLGFYNPRSQIRVRLVGRGVEAVDRSFFAARLQEARGLRAAVLPPDTTGYRLLNAEGDGVPAWTVDRFGDLLVSQITCAGLEALRGEAYAALEDAFPGCRMIQLNDLPARKKEKLSLENELVEPVERDGSAVSGELPGEVEFRESGLTFLADPAGGQKTGFYCDQRENRRRLEALAGGRDLLDLFAHTGAFGLYARRGGAGRIVHVESSPRLIEQGRRIYRANGFGEDAAEWREANVFEWLREAPADRSFGLVACDPPPLVRRRSELDRGARAYKDVNRLALERVEPGGFFLTFSCSGAVDAKLFRQILFSAAREAGVRLQLLEPLAAGRDHPVAVTHPEGEYLQGWLCRVVGDDL